MIPDPVLCFACEKVLAVGERVWWHKKYAEAAAFHEGCREEHRDYLLIEFGKDAPLFDEGQPR